MNELTLQSRAKINLGLRILGKRPDGYHDIETVFQEIDLADTVTFRKTPASSRISAEGISIPTDDRNLVHHAWDVFRRHADLAGGLDAHIQKRIPVGAGLGGGSSNAAATLIAVNRLWDAGLSATELAGMAVSVGSDVPFFVFGGTALGEGRGERLTPIRIKTGFWIVLACPDVAVSTAWAYGRVKLDLTKPKKLIKLGAILGNCALETFKDALFNDLECVVFEKHPELRAVKEKLYERGAFYASMSGSGSSVFGLFRQREQAERVAAFISMEKSQRSFLAKPVPTAGAFDKPA